MRLCVQHASIIRYKHINNWLVTIEYRVTSMESVHEFLMCHDHTNYGLTANNNIIQ